MSIANTATINPPARSPGQARSIKLNIRSEEIPRLSALAELFSRFEEL